MLCDKTIACGAETPPMGFYSVVVCGGSNVTDLTLTFVMSCMFVSPLYCSLLLHIIALIIFNIGTFSFFALRLRICYDNSSSSSSLITVFLLYQKDDSFWSTTYYLFLSACLLITINLTRLSLTIVRTRISYLLVECFLFINYFYSLNKQLDLHPIFNIISLSTAVILP